MISSHSLCLCHNYETRTKLPTTRKSVRPIHLLLLFCQTFDICVFLLTYGWTIPRVMKRKQHKTKQKTICDVQKDVLKLTSITLGQILEIHFICLFVCLFELFGKTVLLTHSSYTLYRHSLNQSPILSKTSPFVFLSWILSVFCDVT